MAVLGAASRWRQQARRNVKQLRQAALKGPCLNIGVELSAEPACQKLSARLARVHPCMEVGGWDPVVESCKALPPLHRRRPLHRRASSPTVHADTRRLTRCTGSRAFRWLSTHLAISQQRLN